MSAREIDLLRKYPQRTDRIISDRTIHQRMIASYRNREFFDGNRNCGYGGLLYDGRWEPIARDFIKEYKLTNLSSVLQVMCEKGFLLYEFLKLLPLVHSMR